MPMWLPPLTSEYRSRSRSIQDSPEAFGKKSRGGPPSTGTTQVSQGTV